MGAIHAELQKIKDRYFSTISTLLKRMEAKEWLKFDRKQGRPYSVYTQVEREMVLRVEIDLFFGEIVGNNHLARRIFSGCRWVPEVGRELAAGIPPCDPTSSIPGASLTVVLGPEVAETIFPEQIYKPTVYEVANLVRLFKGSKLRLRSGNSSRPRTSIEPRSRQSSNSICLWPRRSHGGSDTLSL